FPSAPDKPGIPLLGHSTCNLLEFPLLSPGQHPPTRDHRTVRTSRCFTLAAVTDKPVVAPLFFFPPKVPSKAFAYQKASARQRGRLGSNSTGFAPLAPSALIAALAFIFLPRASHASSA